MRKSHRGGTHQLPLCHEALKRLMDELLAITQVLEDFFLENEITAIDAKGGIAYGLELTDEPVGVGGNNVIGKIRLGRNEGGHFYRDAWRTQ